MEKQSYISSRQLIVLLIMTRLPFSTAFYASLHAGQDIQDIALSVPVNFILNFITAIPILLLMKRRPGKDLVECTENILGKAAAVVVAIFYLFCFLALAFYYQSTFRNFYVNNINTDSDYYAIVIPLLIVCVYGAIKGIESIARFGSLVIVFYLIILSIIAISLIPQYNPHYFLPLLYHGPKYFLGSVVNGLNSNFQILLFAFSAPFLKSGTKTGKLFSLWNVFASLLYLLLVLLTIFVLGPFAAKQNFPLYTLSVQSQLGVFERVDYVDMISFIINETLILMIFLYFCMMCLTKIGVNRHRKIVPMLSAVVLVLAGLYFSSRFELMQGITLSPYTTAFTIIAIIVIPLILLLADLIKRRVSDEKTA